MPTSDNSISSLIINELTQAQYDALVNAGSIRPNELYMVTDTSYPTTNELSNVAFSGEYDDLLNKPTIPDAVSELSNDLGFINSSALSDYALTNSLSDVATTGEYSDLKNIPSIPAAQVQSDWNATSGMGVILNKPTIPTVDQTYNASSANAQSGVAVANAIDSKIQIVNSAEYANITPVANVIYFITE